MRAGIVFFTLVSPRPSSGNGWFGAKCLMSLRLSLHRYEMGTIYIEDLWGVRPGAWHTVHVPCTPLQLRSHPPHGPGKGRQMRWVPFDASQNRRHEAKHRLCLRWDRGGIRLFTPEPCAPQQSFATPSPDQRDVYCVFTCKGTRVHFYIILKLLLCYWFFFFFRMFKVV